MVAADAVAVLAGVRYIALYLRISKDRTGRVEGVGRQEKWGRAYVAQAIAAGVLPDLPIRVFKDNDVSAFDDDAHRPGYDDLRDCLRRGEVAAIWTVEQTRLEANRRRWVEFTSDADDAGLREIHTNRDGLVRLDEVADIKAVLSHYERKRLRERLHDTLGDMADEGRPSGATCYGYVHGTNERGEPTLHVVPEEAAVIRWIVEALDAGWSQTAVARALNTVSFLLRMFGHRGIPPKMAGRIRKDGKVFSALWAPMKVKGVVTNATVAGLRVYKGRVHRTGTWEPILDEVTWHRVRGMLAKPRRVERPDGKTQQVGGRLRPSRGYLLTGWAACGRPECGHHLTGRRLKSKRPGRRLVVRPAYFCVKGSPEGQAGGGCARLSVQAAPFEADFVERFLRHLASDDFRARLASDGREALRSELRRQLTEVEQRHVKLATRWAQGDMPDAAWDAARVELDEQTARLGAELASIPPPVDEVDPDRIIAAWDVMTLDERRKVISLYISRVVVHPGTRGVTRFDPGRVTIYDLDGNEVA